MTPSTCCHPNLEFGDIIDFCSCWMNFIISLKEKGDSILHCCSASFCLQGKFTASKLNLIWHHFTPFVNWWAGGGPRAYETLACYLWPVSRLWTGEILNTKSPLATISKLNKEATVPSAGILGEMQMMTRRSTSYVTNRSKMQTQG